MRSLPIYAVLFLALVAASGARSAEQTHCVCQIEFPQLSASSDSPRLVHPKDFGCKVATSPETCEAFCSSNGWDQSIPGPTCRSVAPVSVKPRSIVNGDIFDDEDGCSFLVVRPKGQAPVLQPLVGKRGTPICAPVLNPGKS